MDHSTQCHSSPIQLQTQYKVEGIGQPYNSPNFDHHWLIINNSQSIWIEKLGTDTLT